MEILQIAQWNQQLAEISARERLEFATRNCKSPLFTSSLGPEDQLISAWIAERGLAVRIVTLDTGRIFEETQTLLEQTRKRYGLAIESLMPAPADVEPLLRQHGPNLFRNSVELRRACCRVRKVLPLARAAAGHDIWITGLRREQTEQRGQVPFLEWDAALNLLRLHPLADLGEAELWQELEAGGIPTNPLHRQGFASIGCAPCTRAVGAGEPARAGRWWWESESDRECGLHVLGERLVPAASYEI
jgi:phosphoadenosine phosphosulfate reductase